MALLKPCIRPAARWRSLLGFVAVLGCDAFADPYSYEDDSPLAAPAFSSGGTAPLVYQCSTFTGLPVKSNEFFPVLYSWLSDDEWAKLQDSHELLIPRSAQATTILDQWQAESSTLLVEQGWTAVRRFAFAVPAVLHTWPSPFATFFGPLGNTYEDGVDPAPRSHLLRIELREEAVLVAESGEGLRAYASDGQVVPIEQLELEPERVAAVLGYHALIDGVLSRATLAASSPQSLCASSAVLSGARSILLINPALVQSWSVGTDEIAQRMQDDVRALREYLEDLRQFGQPPLGANATCSWFSDATTCETSFAQALSTPAAPYSRTVESLVSLIDSMENLPAEDESLVVDFPTSAGGAGGAVSR